jgi:general stress protein 26
MIEIDFSQLKNEIIEKLNKNKHIVLATAADNDVSARTMSYVNFDLDIYMQTDKNYNKIKQISVNPEVALCLDNLQISGKALILDHPLLDKYKNIMEKYKERNISAFNKYSHLINEVLIKIEISNVTVWKYIDNRPFRGYLNTADEKCFCEEYKM